MISNTFHMAALHMQILSKAMTKWEEMLLSRGRPSTRPAESVDREISLSSCTSSIDTTLCCTTTGIKRYPAHGQHMPSCQPIRMHCTMRWPQLEAAERGPGQSNHTGDRWMSKGFRIPCHLRDSLGTPGQGSEKLSRLCPNVYTQHLWDIPSSVIKHRTYSRTYSRTCSRTLNVCRTYSRTYGRVGMQDNTREWKTSLTALSPTIVTQM